MRAWKILAGLALVCGVAVSAPAGVVAAAAYYGIHSWLGVTVRAVDHDLMQEYGLPDTSGALITSVVQESAASRAGLVVGDAIIAVNGKKIEGPAALQKLLRRTKPGKSIELTIVRDQETITLKLRTASMPILDTPLL